MKSVYFDGNNMLPEPHLSRVTCTQEHYQIEQPYIGTGGYQRLMALTFCLNLAQNITQLCIGGLIFSAFIIANITSFSETLAQHILLCTTGYFILIAQAVLSLSPFGWANNLTFENKRIYHFALNLVGSILAITGTSIRIVDTVFSFHTGHGICGFAAMVLLVCNLLGGILSLVFPETMNNRLMKITHSCLGVGTLCLAFMALIFAFHCYYRQVLGDRNANFSIMLAVFGLMGTILMVVIQNIKRILNV